MSISLIIRVLKIKTTMRYHLIFGRMGIKRQMLSILETGTSCWREYDYYCIIEPVGQFLKNFKLEIPNNETKAFLNIIQGKWSPQLPESSDCNLIHNSWYTTQPGCPLVDEDKCGIGTQWNAMSAIKERKKNPLFGTK